MISCTRFEHSKIVCTLQLTNNSMFHLLMHFTCMYGDERHAKDFLRGYHVKCTKCKGH